MPEKLASDSFLHNGGPVKGSLDHHDRRFRVVSQPRTTPQISSSYIMIYAKLVDFANLFKIISAQFHIPWSRSDHSNSESLSESGPTNGDRSLKLFSLLSSGNTTLDSPFIHIPFSS